MEIAKATFPRALNLAGLRVVIDCANGAAYKVAPVALYELGAEVIKIGVEPNGSNINAECGSTHPDAMIAAVKEYRADIGIALDGDADRLLICDEKGQVVDGDQIMALIAGDWARREKLSGGGVVATVMSNLGLERFLQARKLKLERTAVGDRAVMMRMREGGFNLGGEQSGHIILSDFSTTGDGLLAALQVLAVLKRGRQADERAGPPVRAGAAEAGECPLRRRQAAGRRRAVQGAIADAEQRLNGSGRVLVRASGTEPLIRIMAEGDDEKLVNQVVKDIAGAVKKAAAAA